MKTSRGEARVGVRPTDTEALSGRIRARVHVSLAKLGKDETQGKQLVFSDHRQNGGTTIREQNSLLGIRVTHALWDFAMPSGAHR